MSDKLNERLEELNEELELANQTLKRLIEMDVPEDLNFQIEAITENINSITKEMSSIVEAIN